MNARITSNSKVIHIGPEEHVDDTIRVGMKVPIKSSSQELLSYASSTAINVDVHNGAPKSYAKFLKN